MDVTRTVKLKRVGDVLMVILITLISVGNILLISLSTILRKMIRYFGSNWIIQFTLLENSTWETGKFGQLGLEVHMSFNGQSKILINWGLMNMLLISTLLSTGDLMFSSSERELSNLTLLWKIQPTLLTRPIGGLWKSKTSRLIYIPCKHGTNIVNQFIFFITQLQLYLSWYS